MENKLFKLKCVYIHLDDKFDLSYEHTLNELNRVSFNEKMTQKIYKERVKPLS